MSGIVTVHPTYGLGWTDGARTIEVPPAFQIALSRDSDALIGTVEAGHDLAGWQCRLTQRHTEWDGCVNVQLTGPNGRLGGYANIPVEAFS